MKMLERLFLSLLRPQVQHAQDRLQFAYQPDHSGTSGFITSDTVVSSTGAPQGTVLAPLLFTLYTSDFCYNSELCHIQKYADDTAIVGCIRDDREEEYRRLVGDFAAWCHTNHLQLNTSKTKELVIDFGRSRPDRDQSCWRELRWRLWTLTNTLGCGWTINWTGQRTPATCMGRHKAGCTS
ncbi:hypothetical protein L3Q82_019768 [Scortum barcoo]|uniref:Uncharacterized protein n=1 Tax=Scortum barcoo TaxID=214431 RepID=A0ACB8VD88_9TELE|nr:hypothetical protein L3Q82_019768 [Scortum barcoo]